MQLEICFCCDHRLIQFIPVVLNSIQSNNRHHQIGIHLIHNISDKRSIIQLGHFVGQHSNLEFSDYYIQWCRSYRGLSHVSRATMLRLFIPQLLKADKVIYLDIDVIVNLDLAQLYQIDCGSTGIALKNSIDPNWRKLNGIVSGNCGVMVMNLDTLRQKRFTDTCLAIHNEYPNQHDQFIINQYCNGQHGVLPPHFNVFLNQDDQIIQQSPDFILHYAGGKKPYFHHTGKYQYLWDQYTESSQQQVSRSPISKHVNNKLNLGILSYQNSYHRRVSSNIGDYIQTLAVINIYRKFLSQRGYLQRNYDIKQLVAAIANNTIPDVNFIWIKRDNLSDTRQYGGHEGIITVMNGWWMHPCDSRGNIDFKIPNNITPIFVAFHIANDKLLSEPNLSRLRKYSPIGCRDYNTLQLLQDAGVESYFSGCLTTTIDFFRHQPRAKAPVYRVDAGRTRPGETVVAHCREQWKNGNPNKCLSAALEFLRRYSQAERVITSRLHCFLPCLAMGVPVEFTSPNGTDATTWGSPGRFGGLRELAGDNKALQTLRDKLTSDALERLNVIHNNLNLAKLVR